MQHVYPEIFFKGKLDDQLFLPDQPVWNALKLLSDYVLSKCGSGIEVEIDGRVILLNREQIVIGPGCVIEPGALIEGPCIIGAGCTIRFGAAVRADSLIGNNCIVGHSSEIKRSILLDESKTPHFNYVGDSILGHRVNFGCGAKTGNLRLDRKEIQVIVKGKKVNTGLKKFGGILGDDCSVGCNCVINPGTLMHKKGLAMPCSAVRGTCE